MKLADGIKKLDLKLRVVMPIQIGFNYFWRDVVRFSYATLIKSYFSKWVLIQQS